MTDLSEVARIYTTAWLDGRPPARAVELEMQRPRPTVSRWIRRAREAGLIDSSVRGQPPRRNRKILAIAAELGVSPEDLAAAVMRHADGDLRIMRGDTR